MTCRDMKELMALRLENTQLHVKLANAPVHTINGSCYIKCADVLRDAKGVSLAKHDADVIRASAEYFNVDYNELLNYANKLEAGE